jgi:hypothetical protein
VCLLKKVRVSFNAPHDHVAPRTEDAPSALAARPVRDGTALGAVRAGLEPAVSWVRTR